MIIAGNSNVDAFRQIGLRFSSKPEKIVISWVGAIKAGQFYKGHPAGSKVRNLFNQETGWKFLSIGGHDIFELCMFASMGEVVDHFEEAFDSTINLYTEVFKELNKSGKFAWLVFPHPVHLVPYKNLTADDVLRIVKRFNKRIEDLCSEQGVVVINPLPKMLGPDGQVLKEFLQQDGAHLNINGVQKYVEQIELLTGESFFFRSDTVIFESASEIESFCALFTGELHIPANVAESPQVVSRIIAEFAAKNLKDRGITSEVDAKTKLLSTGLVDKSCFINIRDYATELLGMVIPPDINLNGFDTIDEIVGQLFLKRHSDSGKSDMALLSQKDFLVSLHGDYENITQRELILRADERISNMGDDFFAKMHEIVPLDSRDTLLRYGIISFWFSLNYARRGSYDEALNLIAQSKMPATNNAFPFTSSRTELYRREWKMRIEERLPIWQRMANRAYIKLIIPIRQHTIVIRIFNRLLLPIWRQMTRVVNKIKGYF